MSFAEEDVDGWEAAADNSKIQFSNTTSIVSFSQVIFRRRGDVKRLREHIRCDGWRDDVPGKVGAVLGYPDAVVNGDDTANDCATIVSRVIKNCRQEVTEDGSPPGSKEK